MLNRWNDEDAAVAITDLDMCAYSSRLIGNDSQLVHHGGGNTSVKSTHIDYFGDTQDIIWVKASGFDLASMGPEGFTALEMNKLLKCATLKTTTQKITFFTLYYNSLFYKSFICEFSRSGSSNQNALPLPSSLSKPI